MGYILTSEKTGLIISGRGQLSWMGIPLIAGIPLKEDLEKIKDKLVDLIPDLVIKEEPQLK